MDNVIVIGAGGNGLLVAETITASGHNFCGFLDDNSKNGKVLGRVLSCVKYKGYKFVYALMTVKKQEERVDLFYTLPFLSLGTYVHPSATVSPHVHLSPGVVILPGARVCSNAGIGLGTIVYENAVIDHHGDIGCFVSVCNGASVGAHSTICTGAHIGSNSTIIEYNSIGCFAIVGAGAVVTHSVSPSTTVVGNPARAL